MEPAKRKALIEKAESLLAVVRSGVLVHLQDGVYPRQLRLLLESTRALTACTSKIDDDSVVLAGDALEAWHLLLANEIDQISHTRALSLLDQITEVEIALVACRSDSGITSGELGDFVEESFGNLQISSAPPTATNRIDDSDQFEIDAEMLDVFREEATSLVQSIKSNLDILAARPDDREALWEIKRNAHTFKGAAAIVGLRRSSELAHRVEDLLDRLSQADSVSNAGLISVLINAAECLNDLSTGESSARLDLRLDNLCRDLERAAETEPVIADFIKRGDTFVQNTEPRVDTPPPVAKQERKSSIVRISLDRLDELVRNVRELLLVRSQFEDNLEELEQQLEESCNNTMRLLSANSKIEKFNPGDGSTTSGDGERRIEFRQNMYELSETAKDALVIDSELLTVKDGFDELYEVQRSMIVDIQDRLMRLRNVEFGTIATRLQRTIRVTCDEEAKKADLEIVNGWLEIDTQVIDVLMEPLMHLLKNAVVHGIEYSETRRLLGKPEAGKIAVSIKREGGEVVLGVSDDGRGIAFQTLVDKAVSRSLIDQTKADSMTAKELRELLFLPGLTTAESINLNAGRGVGMSIVRESIEAAGGNIWFDSLPQKGTTFYIRLPLPYADENQADAPQIDEHSRDEGLSILIVDDSPSVRLMLSRAMAKIGWKITTAKNGVEALNILASATTRPNVILSDIEMPKMGGFELHAALREDETLKNIPLIFISSRAAAADREKARVTGAAAYLTKPCDEAELLDLVQRLAGKDMAVLSA